MQQTNHEILKTWEEFNHANRCMSIKVSIKYRFLTKLVNNKLTNSNNEMATDWTEILLGYEVQNILKSFL